MKQIAHICPHLVGSRFLLCSKYDLNYCIASHSTLVGAGNDSTYELEEGEWIPDDWTDSADPNADVMDEG